MPVIYNIIPLVKLAEPKRENSYTIYHPAGYINSCKSFASGRQHPREIPILQVKRSCLFFSMHPRHMQDRQTHIPKTCAHGRADATGRNLARINDAIRMAPAAAAGLSKPRRENQAL
jgi:hypothetical protein